MSASMETMNPLVIIMITIFGATGFWEVLRAIIVYKTSKTDKTTSALLALLRNELLITCRRAIARGFTTVVEMDSVVKLYKSYEDLGGNGTIREFYLSYKELPCKEISDLTDNDKEGLV